MIDFCSHGIRKCVPSFTTCSCTPDNRSKITARVPPLTSYMAAWPRETARKTGTAHFEIALRPAAMMATNRQNGVSVVLWSSTFLDVASFVDHHSLAWKSSAKPAAAKLQQSTSSQLTFPPHCHLNPGPCQLCIYTHGQDASHTGLAPAGHKTLESQSSRSEERRVSASLCKRAFNSRLKEHTRQLRVTASGRRMLIIFYCRYLGQWGQLGMQSRSLSVSIPDL